LQDDSGCIKQRAHPEIVSFRDALIVAMIDEERLAPGTPSRLDITPAVTDHIALSAIDVQFLGSLCDQTRQRLPAPAPVIVIVGASPNRI
jgi:hypothetical protein